MVWHLETWGHRLRTVAFLPHVRLVMRGMFGRDSGVMLGHRWPLRKHAKLLKKHEGIGWMFLEMHGSCVSSRRRKRDAKHTSNHKGTER